MLNSSTHHKKEKGFSTIELFIVMVIAVILMTVATPMFRSFTTNRNLKEAAAALMSDMKLAKQRAAAESIEYRITINRENNNYTVKDCCDVNCNNLGCVYNVTNNLSKYGSNVTFTSDTTYNNITFQSRGTCTPGHVTLQNSLGSIIQIITSITGRIRSEEIFKS